MCMYMHAYTQTSIRLHANPFVGWPMANAYVGIVTYYTYIHTYV